MKSPLTGAPGKQYTVIINGMVRDIIYQQKDIFFVDAAGDVQYSNTASIY